MSELKEKQNDWFVSIALNKDLGLSDFSEMGLNQENTQLQNRDYYKNKKFIQDNFKTSDGSFDESTFNKTYDIALKSFRDFNTGSFKDDKDQFLSQMEHSYSDLFKYDKSKLKNTEFEVKKIHNPFLEKKGLQGIGTTEESNLSISEIAQRGKVIDYNTGKTLDWSANDKGGLKGFFNRDSLVLAQWDEDGTHEDPETGRIVQHKAGDYKFNSDGELCYETLGNRDASTKNFLSAFDTITIDGSMANKFDIFDADDKEQNITKTIARAALKYAPVAIGSTVATGGILPAISAVYLGTTALMNLGEALPGLYKAIEGIALGDESDDISKKGTLWNAMNSLEGRMKQYRFGTSEYSQKKTFTIENFINLIGDVSLQLGQQTTIAKIPSYLGLDKRYIDGAKTIDEFQKRALKANDFSRNLATAYMTITSGTDAYGRAKEAGHTDRAAGLITLGTLFGLHKVMQSEIGQWPLKGIGLDDLRLAAKPILKEESEKLAKAIGDKSIDIATEKSKKAIINKLSESINKGLRSFIDDPSRFAPAMLNEAIEEVSEEMVGDFNMAIGAAASALGVTRKVNTDFSFGDVAQRYAMAGFGGAIGGGIHRLKTPWGKAHKSLENGEENKKLLNLVWENGADAICDEIDREYKSGLLVGDKNSSVNKYEIKDDDVFYLTADSEQDSQAWAVKEGLKNLVRTYEELLTKSGSVSKEADVRRALMNLQDPEIQALTEFGLEERVASHLEFYNKKIIDIEQKLSELGEADKDFNVYTTKLAELKFQKEAILNGEHFDHYFQQGLLFMDKNAKSLFTYSTIEDFTKAKLGKDYESLSDIDKNNIKEGYEMYKNDTSFMNLEYAVDILNNTFKNLAPTSLKYGEEYSKVRKQTFDLLSKSLQASSDQLKIFDDNGEVIDSLKSYLTHNNTVKDINSFNLFNPGDIDFSKPLTPIQQRKLILSTILSNLQQLVSTGLPLDGEVANSVNEVRRNTILNVNNYIKDNYQNSEFAEKYINGLDAVAFLPVINELHKADFNNPEIAADIDELIKKAKKLENSEILNSNGINDLEVFKEEAGDENMSDEDAAKLIKEGIIGHLQNLKNNLNEFAAMDLQFLDQTEALIKNTADNPIYEYLNKVTQITGNQNEGVIDMLKDESKRLMNIGLDEYLVANPDKLRSIKKDIEITQTLIGMSIKSNSNNTYGTILNKFRSKYRNVEELPLLNVDTALLMLTDLEQINEKIDFLLKLSNYNAADRLREQEKSAARFHTLFTEIFNLDPTQPGALLAQINEAHPDLNLLNGISDIFTNNLDLDVIDELKEGLIVGRIKPELMRKAEKLLTLLESQIYKNFKEASKNIDQAEILKKIINSNYFSLDPEVGLLSGRTKEIHSSTESLNEFDKGIYLMTIFGSDMMEFKQYLKNELSSKETNSKGEEVDKYPYAPLFAQEYPCKIAFSFLNNTDLFNEFLSLLKTKDNKQLSPYLENLMYIIGYHGTGKTSATGKLIHNIIEQKYGKDKITITSIVKRQTDKFVNSLNPSSKGYTKDELITEILNGKSIKEFINEDKTFTDFDFVNEEKLKELGDNLNIKEFIFIDEVTWYDTTELSILTKWAKLNNKKIITLGDDLQQGASKDVSYFNCIKSPVIEYSLRSGSTIVKDNSDEIRVLTKEINELDYKEETREKIIEKFNNSWNKTIKYHIDKNNILTGTKIISKNDSLNYVDSFISSVLNNNNPSGKKSTKDSIAVIYETQEDYNKLKTIIDKYDINAVKLSEMQGSEFDYVISAVNIKRPTSGDYEDYVSYVKKINTLFSRAIYGNLILGDSQGLINKQVNDNNILTFDKERLSVFRSNRISNLEFVTEGQTIEVKQEESEESKESKESKEPETSQPEDPKTKVNPTIKQTSQSEVNNILNKQIEDEVDGKIDDFDNIVEGKGKNVNDGKLLGYSSFVSFGGTISNEKAEIPFYRNNLRFDLQMFKDGNTFGTYNLYENGLLNRKLFQDFDLIKKEILLNNKSIKEIIENNEYKGLFQDKIDDFDWDNAEYRILYTKRDLQEDFNNEIKNTYSSSEKYIKRLILHVPSLTGDFDGVITLAELGTKPIDSLVSKFDKIAKSRIESGENYYMTKVGEEGIKISGISTRLIPKDDPNHIYSYADLKDDLSWKNMSDPMIFTGRTEFLNQISQVTDNNELADAIINRIKDYNLNGRPVMFISKHSATKGWDSDKLANYFWEQKLNKIKSELGDPSAKEIPNYVNMVVLAPQSLTGEEFFNKFGESIEDFKKDSKSAAKKIHTLSHKYLGLSILRNLYEYIDYTWTNHYDKNTKQWDIDTAEKMKLNNITGLVKFIELAYGLGSKKININGVEQIHIVFKGKGLDFSGSVVNIDDDKKLNTVVDLINKRNKTDYRSTLYNYYYKNYTTDTFNFSDILTTLYDLTLPNGSKLLEENNDEYTDNKYQKINSSYARKNLIDVLTKSKVARFPQGFEYHPIYKSDNKDKSGRTTNWVEACLNDPNTFNINKLVIESQRVLIDYNHVYDLETAKQAEESIKKENEAKKIGYKSKITDLKLKHELENTINSIIDSSDIKDIDDKINNELSKKTISELNDTNSENPIFKIYFVEGNPVIEYIKDLNSVTELLDNKKLKQINVNGKNPELIFENNDLTTSIYELQKNGTLKLINSNQSPEEFESELEIKTKKYTEDVNSFVEKFDEDFKLQLANILSIESNSNFLELTTIVNQLKMSNESDLDKFKELINDKLEILC